MCPDLLLIKEYGISYEQFSRMSQAKIEREVDVKNNHPNSGSNCIERTSFPKGKGK